MGFFVYISCSFNTDLLNNYRMERLMTIQEVLQGIQKIQSNTQTVDSVLSDMPSVSNFLTNVALKESYAGAGLDSTATHTLGPWQMDPIKMFDMQQRMTPGSPLYDPKFGKRGDDINAWFTSQGYEDFDIKNLAQVIKGGTAEKPSYSYGELGQYARDPLAHAFLARLGIAPFKEAVPKELGPQGIYWKKYWNTSGKGKPEQFVDIVNHWDKVQKEQEIIDKTVNLPANKAFKYE